MEPPPALPAGADRPARQFADAVDDYVAYHGISRAECFRRIAAVTGDTPASLAQRYRDRGRAVWRLSAPFGVVEIRHRDPQ